MKCTSCRKGVLKPSHIDDLFPGYTCNHCGGNWLYLKDYLRWREKKEDADLPPPPADFELGESKGAIPCPKTGRVMLKYRISKDQQHMLDLSPDINGIWLDKGEWDLLKQEGLAMHLNAIFTDPWQRKIRSGKTREVFESLYEDVFGEQDYENLKDVRKWIYSKANKAEYLAYLLAENPYSAS